MRATLDEHAVGEGCDVGDKRPLVTFGGQAVSVELAIDGGDGHGAGETALRVPGEPGRREPPVVGAPALAAGPMAGGERGGLVEEEQLRIAARGSSPPAGGP